MASYAEETVISHAIAMHGEAKYEPKFKHFDYAYWMTSKDAKVLKKTEYLPQEDGYMYGKISMGVGYDQEKDFFIGFEEPKSMKEQEEYFSDIVTERLRVGS